MKLQEVFSQLAYGELSQHVLGTHAAGIVDPAQHAALVNHLNLGLTALYKRFNLKEGQLTLALQAGRLTYPLTQAFAVTTRGSPEPVRHIADSALAPFQDDLLKIERVYTASGWEMALNNPADAYSCLTPSLTTLRVPADVVARVAGLPTQLQTDTLTVVYRAKHPTLVIEPGEFFPDEIELELPASHLEALLYFVASRVNNPIGMGQEFNAGNNWFNRYETECQRLEATNLRIDTSSDSDRMVSGGWV